MGWNFRSSGNWSSIDPKVREGGQWKSVGGGGGGGNLGDEYTADSWYGPEWREPPTRSNEDYVSNYAGLDAALSNVNQDTTLYLDNGPYTGSGFTLEQSNVTISGEGYPDAEVHHDYNNQYQFSNTPWDRTDVSCDNIVKGDTVITGVSDTSPFSVGDEVRLWDNTDRYVRGVPGGSGSNDSADKSMFNEVASVGSNSVELVEPAALDFGGDTEIQHINWNIENIHYTGIDFHGDGREYDPSGTKTRYRLLSVSRVKDAWFTNLRAYDVHGMGMSFYRSLNCYSRDTLTNGVRYYGIQASSGAENAHIHNHQAINAARYAFACGGGGSGGVSFHLRTYDCESYGCAATCDSHFGAEDVIHRRAYATGDVNAHPDASDGNSTLRDHNGSIHRLRGYDQHADGGFAEVSSDAGADISHAQQWAADISYQGLESNVQSYEKYGFDLTTSDSTYPIQHCLVRNCDLHGSQDPFRFRRDIEDLVVEDYYWNGNLVTGADIEACNGYSSHSINYTVNNSV